MNNELKFKKNPQMVIYETVLEINKLINKLDSKYKINKQVNKN